MNKHPLHTAKYIVVIWCIVAVLHLRAYDAGFVTDFTGLMARMEGKGLGDALASFGFPSLMPLLNLVYFALHTWAGLSPIIWYGLFTLVYSVGLYYFWRFAMVLLESAGIQDSSIIALSALVVILTCPYQVEAIVWKVGLGHLMSVALIMAALYYASRWMTSNSDRLLYLVCGLQMLSLLCFEWALLLPLYFFGLTLFYASRAYKLVYYSLGITVLYLVATKIIIGVLIGHYEIDAASLIDVKALVSTITKYYAKHLVYAHFMDYPHKEMLYGLCDKAWLVSVAVVLFGCIVSFLFRANG